MIEILKIGVPSVVVPLTVFAMNWGFRHKNDYAQTAASDFILAVLIFDAGAIAATESFVPFVRDLDLRTVFIVWHMLLAALGLLFWGIVVIWGEPAVARYYRRRASRHSAVFPFVQFGLCWMAAFFLICVHAAFYLARGTT